MSKNKTRGQVKKRVQKQTVSRNRPRTVVQPRHKLLNIIDEWKKSGRLQAMYDEMCQSPDSFKYAAKQFGISGNVLKTIIEGEIEEQAIRKDFLLASESTLKKVW